MNFFRAINLLGLQGRPKMSKISQAFRRISWKLHPDKNTLDESAMQKEKLKQISAAYNILKANLPPPIVIVTISDTEEKDEEAEAGNPLDCKICCVTCRSKSAHEAIVAKSL